MYQKYEEYINTTQDGLIIMIEHNLNTLFPSMSLFEPVDLTDMKAVPLYDSRITSIESKGLNVTQVSFNGAFEGYVNLLHVKNARNTIENRLSDLETLADQTRDLQKKLVSLAQWKQMNNYFEQKTVDLEGSVKGIESELDSIKKDLDNL
jgi:hypothetical protein